MPDALTIEGLGKRYLIQRTAETETDTDALQTIRGWFRRPSPDEKKAKAPREFWALKEVSLTVEPGTILGVIGANGAGKSTLLKVVARVTRPTTGHVVGRGRVVSLLELGAGFNEEVSARENIFMNAALNGISRHEVLERFDGIISFAELGEFVDVPLKHYSSGMYLRLAFSAAINMRPDILLADEILAVGDASFQERCLDTVEEAGRNGLTVLFVSHDMEAVMRICNRVIWIDAGQIVKSGDPEEVVTEYQNTSWAKADAATSEKGRRANRWAEILSVRMVSSQGREVGSPSIDEDHYIRIRIRTTRGRLSLKPSLDLHSKNLLLFRSSDRDFRDVPESGFYDAMVRIPARFLSEGINYSATVSVTINRDGKEYVLVSYNALSFLAYNADEAAGRVGRRGLLDPQLEWTLESTPDAPGTQAAD
jgi:lipopolysaccharide transport system ATP-binding protein